MWVAYENLIGSSTTTSATNIGEQLQQQPTRAESYLDSTNSQVFIFCSKMKMAERKKPLFGPERNGCSSSTYYVCSSFRLHWKKLPVPDVLLATTTVTKWSWYHVYMFIACLNGEGEGVVSSFAITSSYRKVRLSYWTTNVLYHLFRNMTVWASTYMILHNQYGVDRLPMVACQTLMAR